MLPELLKNRIIRRDCVAYIGAGLSMACGMPNWTGLMRILVTKYRTSFCNDDPSGKNGFADACDSAIQENWLTMAASQLRRLFSMADLDEAIREEFDDQVLLNCPRPVRERMERRLAALVRAPWAGIVTTNYDTLIEREIVRTGDRTSIMVTGDEPRLGNMLASSSEGRFFFVKIHGSIAGSGLVLSSEEYDRAYLGTPRIATFLSALMLRYHVVFVGCSLEDEIVRIRRKLAVDFHGMIPSAYALMKDSKQTRERSAWLRDNARIECILYPEKDNEHTSVDKFLLSAAQCADQITPEKNRLTSMQLSKTPFRERLSEIGAVNYDLLNVIAKSPEHALDRLELVDLRVLAKPHLRSSITSLSPEERVYRALFLVSIGLLKELQHTNKTIYYQIPNTVLTEMNKRARKSS